MHKDEEDEILSEQYKAKAAIIETWNNVSIFCVWPKQVTELTPNYRLYNFCM